MSPEASVSSPAQRLYSDISYSFQYPFQYSKSSSKMLSFIKNPHLRVSSRDSLLWHFLLLNTLSYICGQHPISFQPSNSTQFGTTYICAWSPLIILKGSMILQFHCELYSMTSTPPDINPQSRPPSLPTLIWYIILERATLLQQTWTIWNASSSDFHVVKKIFIGCRTNTSKT